MKRTLFAVATLTAIAGAAPSYAQGLVLEINPEQRAIIHEHVVQQRPRAVVIPGGLRVGAVLPADVEINAVPNDWGPEVRRYRYVYWNDQVVLVEPGSRRVVHILD